jgi:hypothetical protein
MAALRAKIMQATTRTKRSKIVFMSVMPTDDWDPPASSIWLYVILSANIPRKNPIIAKGIAKIVWEKRIRLR